MIKKKQKLVFFFSKPDCATQPSSLKNGNTHFVRFKAQFIPELQFMQFLD